METVHAVHLVQGVQVVHDSVHTVRRVPVVQCLLLNAFNYDDFVERIVRDAPPPSGRSRPQARTCASRSRTVIDPAIKDASDRL